MEALQRPVPLPQHEVIMRRALRRQNPSATPATGTRSNARRKSRSEPRERSPRAVARRAWPAGSLVRSATTRHRSDRSDSASRAGPPRGDVQACTSGTTCMRFGCPTMNYNRFLRLNNFQDRLSGRLADLIANYIAARQDTTAGQLHIYGRSEANCARNLKYATVQLCQHFR
jgi:hypothetical protein